jgi:hypothetical protein
MAWRKLDGNGGLRCDDCERIYRVGTDEKPITRADCKRLPNSKKILDLCKKCSSDRITNFQNPIKSYQTRGVTVNVGIYVMASLISEDPRMRSHYGGMLVDVQGRLVESPKLGSPLCLGELGQKPPRFEAGVVSRVVPMDRGWVCEVVGGRSWRIETNRNHH